MVETDRGTSQIDHVIVSNYGIFVIETKNYTGWIFGDDNKSLLDSSYLQKQRKVLQSCSSELWPCKGITGCPLRVPNLKFIPIVVFSINSDLKTKTTSHVVYSTRLLSTIRQYRETVIDGAMKEDIAGRVSGLNIRDRAARAKHVVDIHSSIEANPALAAGENWSLGTERTDSLSAAQVSLNAGIPPLLKIWKAGT